MIGNLLPLLTLEVRREHDVVLCRQRARQLAGAFGFDTQEQTRIATAVSEIARHTFESARGGRIEFAVETASRPTPPRKGTPEQTLVITVRAQKPGLPSGEPRRDQGGPGVGLAGVRRLLDGLEITLAGGTMITARKSFPAAVPVLSAPQLQAAVGRIAAEPPSDALAELQFQNQELIRAMDEVQKRQEDLARVNQELADTNSGVLALYDELETLHRVGGLLAAQLDLKTLLQAIIDATTDLTEAPFGAFYYRAEADGAWRLQAMAGPACAVLSKLPASHGADFFGAALLAERGADAPEDGLAEGAAGCTSQFAEALAGCFDLRSCLMIPVTSDSETLGAMVFGSDRAAAFTERSERIVSSIAAQAAIGIEKARLFDKVQGSNAAKDRFLAMLSHELRTPLNPVLAVVSNLVNDGSLPPETLQDLDLVLRNVRLEARLIDDLLDFSRISNGKLQLQRERLDLHALVRNVVDICAEEVAAGRHLLTLHLDASQSEVFGDSARLQQVLWNVLKNAVKFTPAAGRISIRTAPAGADAVAVTITDNGVGIDKAALARIFGAFEQGGFDTTARFGGLGLGLAITKAFVDLHGGTIQAASEGPGEGMQITIALPLFQPDKAPGPPAAARVPVLAEESSTGTLLLVDDHADSLQIMGRLLSRHGYGVLLATNCQTALAAAAQNRFDLIVSDLGLPDGSGLTLLGKLREFRDVPAIALSGYGMEENVRQSHAAGYDEHLTKPIDFSLLTLTIGHLLRAARRSADASDARS